MTYDTFISYSKLDKTVADATCAALEASGIRCWIAPRDVTPGIEWGQAIVEAINQCRVMVLIFSANANESPQIRREVERAVSKGIPIIPLRIQEIVPTRSLEYFIGHVHWLDALTPPLELHLRRLTESIKALLQVEPVSTRIGAVSTPVVPWAGQKNPIRFSQMTILAGLLIASMVGIGAWWLFGENMTPPAIIASTSQPIMHPSGQVKAAVDAKLVGTFERSAVSDDYGWHFVLVIAEDGTYHLVKTQQESGTYQAGNGKYRTVGSMTGRAREGTYRAVGSSAIEVSSATGTAVFRPTRPISPISPTNPIMLGMWTSTVILDGLTWTLTIKNNPDGTYHYQAQTEDNGNCVFAEQQWRTTSVVTGQTNVGTYRIIDDRNFETISADGPVVWQRK